MQPQDEHLTEVVDAILRYLYCNPDAADTLEGITSWWLPAAEYMDDRTVLAALTRLEAQGLIHRRVQADQHVLYTR